MSFKYRIFCITEQSYIITNNDNIPTVCPNGSSHVIDPKRTIKIDQNTVAIVQIQDEIPNGKPTSGYFKSIGIETDITQNITTKDTSWVYPISAMCIQFNMLTEHISDIIDVYVIPTIHVGNITQILQENGTIIYMNSTANTTIGMELFITDNKFTFFLGKIVEKNDNDNTITVTFPSDREFNINSYITVKVPIAVNSTIVNNGDFIINVNNTSFMNVGQLLSISDGTNTSDLGEIFKINEDNSIVVENQCVGSFNPGSKIFPKLHVIENYKINSPQKYIIGESTITGSYIKEFYVIRLVYNNSSNTNKTFNWYVEYKY